ncbi:MAG: LPS export ABC transporter periplasmic protein LptC [Saprospiraceae bacterium]|jgi:LPS export ABC transporter protein LptC|nr:LPS export ABC transporter periplasmic protein LptC [Saprospiraceae bacterium]HRD79452.1 LPS export ABC transporter periplasmic protein LptC [Saprospiraceae bacterium]
MKSITFIIIAAILLAGCREEAPETLPDALLSNPNMELLEEVEILYSDSAALKVRVTGPVMHYFTEANDPRQEFPGGVIVHFLDRDQQVASILTAKYAIRRESIGTIIVRDSVVWQSVRKEHLTTDELTWDERRQKVFTDRFVVVTRPGEILYGRGFEANQDFSNLTMKAVEGRVVVDEEKNENQAENN